MIGYRKSNLLFFCLGLFICFGQAQDSMSVFDQKQIKEGKIRKMIAEYEIESIDDFEKVKAACPCKEDSAKFLHHVKTYTINAPKEDVWNTYKSIYPHEAWNCLMVDFGFVVHPDSSLYFNNNGKFIGLREGQIHFVSLNLFGLSKIAVGNQVTEINEDEMRIRFCYLDKGVSEGTQYIQIEAIDETSCKITHYTQYYSGSHFRDKYLYPSFHSMIISAFHKNVKKHTESLYQKQLKQRSKDYASSALINAHN